MTWFGWLYVTFLTLGGLMTVLNIGKPRSPLRPEHVVIILVLNAAMIVGAFTVGTKT